MSASFVEDLAQPEYLHVLLNPLPVYGLLTGILGLGIALAVFRRSQAARNTALLLIAISAASVWPVVHYGEAGFDRVLAVSDSAGGQWLKAHASRADSVEPLYYALAALAVIAIFVPRKWPASAIPVALFTLVFAVTTAGAGAWVAYAGGKIRHSEFRNEPPPLSQNPRGEGITLRSTCG